MDDGARSGREEPPDRWIGDVDLHLFNEGSHPRLYEQLGAHIHGDAVRFAVWAPNAEHVAVVGGFNGWDGAAHPLTPVGSSGIWSTTVPKLARGEVYKYRIAGAGEYRVDKADPYGFWHETPPRTGSVVWDLDYAWNDAAWMAERAARQRLDAPISIYEVHAGSWMRVPEDGNRSLGYRELAHRLADHVERTGFTHVELLPVMEHPFYGSWGYQVTGYFAPSSRWGTPQDLMYLVDHLHQRGIGVILDWVPAHFPTDEHGLNFFDGTHLYEHADQRQGFHPDWKSSIFNYGRNEVKSFLLSSARFWLDRYHIDGLRVDGVASMLYLDYSRQPGEWIPNAQGGRENLEAIALLRELNTMVYRDFPDVQTYAEESTAWPGVSRPTYVGGLGFGFKWDMGWMHDTLSYFAMDPVHRKFHHGQLTFRGLYAYHENFVLPLSHDEVVHGKGSLLGKLPGDEWQQRANLRLLLAYMFACSGKKLVFMGAELGQLREWQHEGSLDWHLLDDPRHGGLCELVGHLNRLYRGEPALHELDTDPRGSAWIDANDIERSMISFERRSGECRERVVCLFNFTPLPRHNVRLGVDVEGHWRELLSTDAREYGGSGQGNFGGVDSTIVPAHGRPLSIVVTAPPLGAVFFKAP
jgi:1,4-alpha-glucan branching enzyme